MKLNSKTGAYLPGIAPGSAECLSLPVRRPLVGSGLTFSLTATFPAAQPEEKPGQGTL